MDGRKEGWLGLLRLVRLLHEVLSTKGLLLKSLFNVAPGLLLRRCLGRVLGRPSFIKIVILRLLLVRGLSLNKSQFIRR